MYRFMKIAYIIPKTIVKLKKVVGLCTRHVGPVSFE